MSTIALASTAAKTYSVIRSANASSTAGSAKTLLAIDATLSLSNSVALAHTAIPLATKSRTASTPSTPAATPRTRPAVALFIAPPRRLAARRPGSGRLPPA